MSASRQLCTFYAGDLFLGIDVQQVQEVFRYEPMTRVPLAPGAIRGLINLRGQIVTALDVRERLGIAARTDGVPPQNVVVRTNDGCVSLLVDEIGDVLEVSDSLGERPPETVTGVARELITHVYKLHERLLLVLDVDRAADCSTSTGSATCRRP